MSAENRLLRLVVEWIVVLLGGRSIIEPPLELNRDVSSKLRQPDDHILAGECRGLVSFDYLSNGSVPFQGFPLLLLDEAIS